MMKSHVFVVWTSTSDPLIDLAAVLEQKMLRVKDEESSCSITRGRGLPRKGAGQHMDEDEEEEGFSESELELYEQYKAAGYRDLVSLVVSAGGFVRLTFLG